MLAACANEAAPPGSRPAGRTAVRAGGCAAPIPRTFPRRLPRSLPRPSRILLRSAGVSHTTRTEAAMARIAGTVYGVLVYVLFLGTFLYAIGFVENELVPRSIDAPGADGLSATALLADAALLGLFAVQHSVMARPAFKRWWTRLVPSFVERSTYVLFASLALLLLCWEWQPIAGAVWTVSEPAPARLLLGISWLGWGTVLVSTFLISHFELF